MRITVKTVGRPLIAFGVSIFAFAMSAGVAGAQSLSWANEPTYAAPFERDMRGGVYEQEEGSAPQERFQRQVVNYATREPAGTIIVDTPNTYLYFVLGNGRAIRYGIGVGREGFTWAGTETITRMAEWPDWHPPAEMIGRQPYLPRFMAGGPGNPLGARAMYLGSSVYRIHGTNDPSTIGQKVSSGCIRLTNENVADLYSRARPGTRVVVLPGGRAMPTAQRSAPTMTVSNNTVGIYGVR